MNRHTAPLYVLAGALVLSACGGGPPGPPALAHSLPESSNVLYDYSNDGVVRLSVMGQNLQITQDGSAELAVGFRETSAGLGVTMRVTSLSATLSQPMGAPLRLDERAVDGPLEFTLDRRGRATLGSRPNVRPEASQMFSALRMAHTFFPTLPGRAVVPGDQWVDTISFAGTTSTDGEEVSVFEYTVRGDTVVDGRTLIRIDLEGRVESASAIDMGGMEVRQSSNVDVTGHVLWDYQARVMYEVSRSGTGTGTVSVPIAPGPLPISVRTTERATLRTGARQAP